MFSEEFNDCRVHMVSIFFACLDCHADTAIWLQGTLERLVCLEAYDLFLAFVKISRSMGRNGRNNFRVHIKDSAFFALLRGQIHNLLPQCLCILCRSCKKAVIT